MLPGCTASAVRAFTSFPTPRHCNETDSKQGSLGHHHMAAQQAQTTRTWRQNQDFTKLPRILRNDKKLLYIWREKKHKIFHFSTKSQALTALWGLLQVLVLLQLCLPVILTNTFKLIPTLPTQKAELLETGVRECVINSAIIKKKINPAPFCLF